MKSGTILKKDNEYFMICDSYNHRWNLNLNTGKLKWLAKAGEGNLKDFNSKDYVYITENPVEFFNKKLDVKEDNSNTEKEEVIGSDKILVTFSGFEDILKQKLGKR